MSQEGEKINLCTLKMDGTLNLCGRNACVAPPCFSNVDGIVGAGECQVISLRVCVFVHFRLHPYLSVWAHEPQSCCTASSISCPLLTSIHISSAAHLPPPGSPPSLFFFRSIARSSGSPRQPAAEQEVGGGLVRSARPASVV